jgi:hypothetical protein
VVRALGAKDRRKVSSVWSSKNASFRTTARLKMASMGPSCVASLIKSRQPCLVVTSRVEI